MDPQVHMVLCCFLQESYCEESTITWYFQIKELDECINTQTSTLLHLWQLLRDHKLGPFMVRCVAPNVGMSIWSLFLTRYLNSVYSFSLMSFCVCQYQRIMSCPAWLSWGHELFSTKCQTTTEVSSVTYLVRKWSGGSYQLRNLICFVLF